MAEGQAKRTWGMRVLDGIEWAGNKLPDPVTLFVLAIFAVIFRRIGARAIPGLERYLR